MPIDIQRILEVAAKTAVEEAAQAAPRKPKKRRLSTGRAMLLGAGLATAGGLVVNHKGRDILDRVQDRIADSKWLGDREPEDAEDFEDDEPESSEDEELSADDEEAMDDSPDPDQQPDADLDEDDAEADEDENQEPAPQRPSRRRTRQRTRA